MSCCKDFNRAHAYKVFIKYFNITQTCRNAWDDWNFGTCHINMLEIQYCNSLHLHCLSHNKCYKTYMMMALMQDHLAPGWQSHFDPKASSYPLQLNSSACSWTWSCWIERVRPHCATVINETTKLNFKRYCEMKRRNPSEGGNRAPTNKKTTYTNIALHVHWESTDAYIGGDYKLPYIPSYLFSTVVMG